MISIGVDQLVEGNRRIENDALDHITDPCTLEKDMTIGKLCRTVNKYPDLAKVISSFCKRDIIKYNTFLISRRHVPSIYKVVVMEFSLDLDEPEKYVQGDINAYLPKDPVQDSFLEPNMVKAYALYHVPLSINYRLLVHSSYSKINITRLYSPSLLILLKSLYSYLIPEDGKDQPSEVIYNTLNNLGKPTPPSLGIFEGFNDL